MACYSLHNWVNKVCGVHILHFVLSKQRYYWSKTCQNLTEDYFPSDSFVRNFHITDVEFYVLSILVDNGTAIVKE